MLGLSRHVYEAAICPFLFLPPSFFCLQAGLDDQVRSAEENFHSWFATESKSMSVHPQLSVGSKIHPSLHKSQRPLLSSSTSVGFHVVRFSSTIKTKALIPWRTGEGLHQWRWQGNAGGQCSTRTGHAGDPPSITFALVVRD